MTSEFRDPEHDQRWQGEVAAYALGSLAGADLERFEAHLAACPACRDDLAAFQPVIDTLAVSPQPEQPRPELRARLMQTVQGEADLLAAAGARADTPAPSRWRGAGRGPRWRRPAYATLAVATAVAALVAVFAVSGGGESSHTTLASLTPAAGSGASAHIRRSGTHIELVVERLADPGAGRTYELWVKRGTAAPRPGGTFRLRSGAVSVPGDGRGVTELLVTAEPAAGSPAPTSAPLIAGAVA